MVGMKSASETSNTSTGSHSHLARRVGFGLAALFSTLSLAACSASSAGTTGPAAPSEGHLTAADTVGTPTSTGTSSSSVEASTVSAHTTAQPGTALAALAKLTVKGRAPKTGYTRAQYGPAWTDDNTAPLGHNGCDTRNDVLRRDLVSITFKSGHCVIASGTLADPYTGKTIKFVRGPHSAVIQIDHVVALSDDWQKGAQKFSAAKRRALANDPLNLIAADGPANEQKSDSDAASWLPPNKAFRCTYVARQVAVKAKYGLWVTSAEKTAIARVLASCPKQPLPSAATALARTYKGTGAAPAPVKTSSAPAPKPSTPKPAPTSTAPSTVYYATCADARAAGAAPLHRGDPGYRAALDRDGDGVACE